MMNAFWLEPNRYTAGMVVPGMEFQPAYDLEYEHEDERRQLDELTEVSRLRAVIRTHGFEQVCAYSGVSRGRFQNMIQGGNNRRKYRDSAIQELMRRVTEIERSGVNLSGNTTY